MTPKLKPLPDQVIVITGASSGIGLVTARMAAKSSAAVVAAARNKDALRSLVNEIKGRGGRAAYVVCDVGQQDAVRHVAERTVAAFGRFDTWVNNAGTAIFGRVWDVPMADWHRMFNTTNGAWSTAPWRHLTTIAAAAGRARSSTWAAPSATARRLCRAPTPRPSSRCMASRTRCAWRSSTTGPPSPISLIHSGRIDTPYNEHAGNYMPMQPVHRGMIYPPEAVAEAILWCAEHPKRDMYIGSQAKFAALLGSFAPRLSDKIMERIMYSSHQSRTGCRAARTRVPCSIPATAATSAAPTNPTCSAARAST
jgi:NADP-dependent 3-hydroxy acid dehydrogenase YdfG